MIIRLQLQVFFLRVFFFWVSTKSRYITIKLNSLIYSLGGIIVQMSITFGIHVFNTTLI